MLPGSTRPRTSLGTDGRAGGGAASAPSLPVGVPKSGDRTAENVDFRSGLFGVSVHRDLDPK